jgi:D-alanyl-D-alanine carboxypeptidase
MYRRTFLKKAAFFLTLANLSPPLAVASDAIKIKNIAGSSTDVKPISVVKPIPVVKSGSIVRSGSFESHVKDQLSKKRQFNHVYTEDIFLEEQLFPILETSLNRLKKIQKTVGYGNFCLLNFDDAIKYSKSYSSIGVFSKAELEFLEMIFYSRVNEYGFMGEKPIKSITGKIIKKDVKKIPRTGNYLYLGRPVETYEKIKKEVGKDVILTSGVRSVMKQFLLFLNKAKASRGNLSMASRSLAPPGYSFHGVGDFDVGKKGYGIDNFTENFTRTDVYKKLINLGYIKFRYEPNNDLGVRFEPWHIEVT